LQEQIAKYRPGTKLPLLLKRNGEQKLFNVVLRNTKGDTSIVKESFSVLGAEFTPITEKDKERLKLMKDTSFESHQWQIKRGWV